MSDPKPSAPLPALIREHSALLSSMFAAARESWNELGTEYRDKLATYELHARELVGKVVYGAVGPDDARAALEAEANAVKSTLAAAGLDARKSAATAALNVIQAVLTVALKIATS